MGAGAGVGGRFVAMGPVYRVGVTISLSGLRRYPIKSWRGEDLTHAVVEPWGLAGDRRWMLVDDAGFAITARTLNVLVLLRSEITQDGLRLRAPGVAALDVSLPDPRVQVPVSVWSSDLTAAPTGPEVAAWVSSVLGVSARLVWLDDPRRRATDAAYGGPGDRVSLADGFPLLLTSQASLDALTPPQGEAFSMTRFRPNVVIHGAQAWAEDDWRRIRIGEARFRVVKGCDRCVFTTIDPETAERGKEPVATLARLRRWDNRTWFGSNLVPEDAGATISVGDQVEVLDAVEPGGGPLR